MPDQIIENLARLRMVIGYLGEKEQFNWWQSSFFTQGSSAFLSPLFPRTQTLARCNGVTRAAALVHDERIGVGYVFHLFRLPEDIEQGIHQAVQNEPFEAAILNIVANKKSALDYLHKQAGSTIDLGVGPTRVGKIGAINEPNSWRAVAGYYLHAFENEQPVFPYFSDIS
jgi:hypothetical protein